IVRLVADRAPSREIYLRKVIDELTTSLGSSRITAKVEGRPKHYYSIHQKMIVRGRDLDDIHDLVGVRILVEDVRDCYAAMGVVHALWQPMPGRFKDYIAQPRFGVYQSLHTTVIGPDGKPLEVQIRTYDMHNTAEYGIAAHWRYKETRGTHDGQAVEIFTSQTEGAGPSRDWLSFAGSPRARAKIKQWFAKERKEEAIEAGKDAIAKEVRRVGLPMQRLVSVDSVTALARELRYPEVSALYAAVGEGHTSARHVVQRLVALLGGVDHAEDELAERATPSTISRRRS